ncbi:MAG: Dam family site-specific DNA-(adenine-N6)-methyltransferase [Desulfobacterales bacterium]|nr:Dam family site-specific DNA-(adenine-N6)-methyltransferase [Desulfobacterales bacterium]
MKSTTFLRWAGGKVHSIDRLITFVPRDYNKGIYWEPFLGGGSMFFSLSPDQAVLSDLNSHLIHCFEMVRDYPDRIYYYLNILQKADSESTYYKIRENYNKLRPSIKQAARFIYLNKTSYNGIFRVNKNGEYNVPYGKKENPAFPSLEHLKEISTKLRKAKLKTSSYEAIIEDVKKGDFIYFDPPYPPLNGTSYFTHYTKERFVENEQVKVADTANKLSNMNCRVMISNADIPLIQNLYKSWHIRTLPVTRWITCKAKRHKVNELVVTNY